MKSRPTATNSVDSIHQLYNPLTLQTKILFHRHSKHPSVNGTSTKPLEAFRYHSNEHAPTKWNRKKLTSRYQTVDRWKLKYGGEGDCSPKPQKHKKQFGSPVNLNISPKKMSTLELPLLAQKRDIVAACELQMFKTIRNKTGVSWFDGSASSDSPEEDLLLVAAHKQMSSTLMKKKLARKQVIQQDTEVFRQRLKTNVKINVPKNQQYFDRVLEKVAEQPLARWGSDSESEESRPVKHR